MPAARSADLGRETSLSRIPVPRQGPVSGGRQHQGLPLSCLLEAKNEMHLLFLLAVSDPQLQLGLCLGSTATLRSESAAQLWLHRSTHQG
jgi:hypothetical protein